MVVFYSSGSEGQIVVATEVSTSIVVAEATDDAVVDSQHASVDQHGEKKNTLPSARKKKKTLKTKYTLPSARKNNETLKTKDTLPSARRKEEMLETKSTLLSAREKTNNEDVGDVASKPVARRNAKTKGTKQVLPSIVRDPSPTTLGVESKRPLSIKRKVSVSLCLISFGNNQSRFALNMKYSHYLKQYTNAHKVDALETQLATTKEKAKLSQQELSRMKVFSEGSKHIQNAMFETK